MQKCEWCLYKGVAGGSKPSAGSGGQQAFSERRFGRHGGLRFGKHAFGRGRFGRQARAGGGSGGKHVQAALRATSFQRAAVRTASPRQAAVREARLRRAAVRAASTCRQRFVWKAIGGCRTGLARGAPGSQNSPGISISAPFSLSASASLMTLKGTLPAFRRQSSSLALPAAR